MIFACLFQAQEPKEGKESGSVEQNKSAEEEKDEEEKEEENEGEKTTDQIIEVVVFYCFFVFYSPTSYCFTAVLWIRNSFSVSNLNPTFQIIPDPALKLGIGKKTF
jgi:hypothetical protein